MLSLIRSANNWVLVASKLAKNLSNQFVLSAVNHE